MDSNFEIPRTFFHLTYKIMYSHILPSFFTSPLEGRADDQNYMHDMIFSSYRHSQIIFFTLTQKLTHAHSHTYFFCHTLCPFRSFIAFASYFTETLPLQVQNAHKICIHHIQIVEKRKRKNPYWWCWDAFLFPPSPYLTARKLCILLVKCFGSLSFALSLFFSISNSCRVRMLSVTPWSSTLPPPSPVQLSSLSVTERSLTIVGKNDCWNGVTVENELKSASSFGAPLHDTSACVTARDSAHSSFVLPRAALHHRLVVEAGESKCQGTSFLRGRASHSLSACTSNNRT